MGMLKERRLHRNSRTDTCRLRDQQEPTISLVLDAAVMWRPIGALRAGWRQGGRVGRGPWTQHDSATVHRAALPGGKCSVFPLPSRRLAA